MDLIFCCDLWAKIPTAVNWHNSTALNCVLSVYIKREMSLLQARMFALKHFIYVNIVLESKWTTRHCCGLWGEELSVASTVTKWDKG